jgi:phospholipid/cholesterol/gamma-HCH transport system permease protein
LACADHANGELFTGWQKVMDFLEQTGRFAEFAGRALTATLAVLGRPRLAVRQLYHIYLGAFPLVLVAGLALGIVIWMHLHGVLARLGPGSVRLLPQALALAVLLEFAPLGAGFIVAGRSGASLGAELGSLKLSEQIDALEVLGLSPWRQLVGPRVLACMISLPLLTVLLAALAVAGSFAAESLGGTMHWQEYWSQCLTSLRLHDIIWSTLRTVVFGFLIGAAGCYFGMTAHGGTEGVGRAATRGVVLSIFLVVVADVILVRAIQLFG